MPQAGSDAPMLPGIDWAPYCPSLPQDKALRYLSLNSVCLLEEEPFLWQLGGAKTEGEVCLEGADNNSGQPWRLSVHGAGLLPCAVKWKRRLAQPRTIPRTHEACGKLT